MVLPNLKSILLFLRLGECQQYTPHRGTDIARSIQIFRLIIYILYGLWSYLFGVANIMTTRVYSQASVMSVEHIRKLIIYCSEHQMKLLFCIRSKLCNNFRLPLSFSDSKQEYKYRLGYGYLYFDLFPIS